VTGANPRPLDDRGVSSGKGFALFRKNISYEKALKVSVEPKIS